MFGLSKAEKKSETPATPRREVVPLVDIHHDADALVITADVPGCRDEDIDLNIDDGVLTLRATPQGVAPEGYQLVHTGLSDVAFVRQFALPDIIDTDAVRATTKDGVLTVTLPKHQAAKPRRIAVSRA